MMPVPRPGTLTRRPGTWGAALLFFFLSSFIAAQARGASCLTATPLFQLHSGGGKPLRQPSDMTIRGEDLFVLDDLNGRTVKYSLGGGYLSTIPLPGGGRSSYLGIDVGGDDNLYLADSGGGKILVVSQDGTRVREFPTGEEGGDSEPVSVDVSRGSCFVSDNEEHKIKVFDLEGNPLNEWGGLGEGPQLFRYPFRVMQDSLGRVTVTDVLNSRVKLFTPKGEPLLEFGEFGVLEGTLFRPAGIDLWDDSLIVVADNYLGSVQLFDLKGAYLAAVCDSGGAPLLFQNPVSLLTRGSTLYVLEMGASRVQALKIERRQLQ